MKQFFRLLLISFGLLLLLGLNEKQSGDSVADLLESSTLTYQDLSACITASSVYDAAALQTGPLMRHLPKHQRKAFIQQEQTISTGIHTHILSSRDQYMEFSPGNLKKTGHAIHLSAQKGDPPLA